MSDASSSAKRLLPSLGNVVLERELVVLHRRRTQRHRVVGVAFTTVREPGGRVRTNGWVRLRRDAVVSSPGRYPLVEVDLAMLGCQPAFRVGLGLEDGKRLITIEGVAAGVARLACRWLSEGRGLPLMEILTPAIRKTSTCPTLPSSRRLVGSSARRLGGDALDRCRRRTQQDRHGHRGRATDPLFRARRTLHTRRDLLTARQRARLDDLFAGDEHVEVEATRAIYQRMIAAYREPDRAKGRQLMTTLIASISHDVPAALSELITLGRTLTKRAGDILAYFDRSHTSNGPTEAINGRLEHLRGTALDFRNLTNYIARSLLETGGFRPQLHPRL